MTISKGLFTFILLLSMLAGVGLVHILFLIGYTDSSIIVKAAEVTMDVKSQPQ